MDQNLNDSNGLISLGDLWTLFLSKLKLLVIVGLLAGIVGGALGAVLSLFGNRYEATIKFYLSPNDGSDTLLYNMQSEVYAEKLFLDKNGLPPKEECKNIKDYEAALEVIAKYEAKREEKSAKKLEIEEFNMETNKEPYDQIYTYLQSKYEEAYLRWSVVSAPQTDAIIDEEYFKNLENLEKTLDEAKEAMDTYYNETYYPYLEEKKRLNGEFDQLSLEFNRLALERNEAVEKVLEPWRKTSNLKDKIELIAAYSTFEYTVLEIPDSENSKDEAKEPVEEIRNKGYITIRISIPENKEFAEDLVERIKSNTVDYIIQHIEEKTGSTNVDCRLISPYSSISETKDTAMLSNAIKFAVIFVALTEVVLYGVLVVIMCSQKKRSVKEDK